MHYRRLTAQEEESVRGYLAEGFSRRSIADRFGVGIGAIDRVASPEAYKSRLERNNASKKVLSSEFAGRRVFKYNGNVDADANKRLAEVPVDTRAPIQIQMGEPMRERSALYRKQTGGEA